MKKNKNSTLVYSTHPAESPEDDMEINKNQSNLSGKTVYIERDRKQRKGKVVTVISNVTGDLRTMLKELQKKCGTGGSVKNGHIEIQGDHRDTIVNILREKGFSVKIKGG